MLSTFRHFKAVIALAAIAATTLLAGCGGGGAKDPFDSGPPAPALVVNPTSATIYANIPTVLTISSGVAPFSAFTSDSVVLPVAASISGTLLTLVPSNVNADTAVTVTIRDGLGRSVAVPVNVKPATLVGNVEIVPLANSACGTASSSSSSPTGVCTGDTATARVAVRSANTAVIPGRQVRLDAVFGNFQFVTDPSGANASSSVTVVTDQNGVANALLKTADGVASQAALIRATDLTTGNRVDTTFTIVQKIDGSAVLSVIPSGGYVGKAFFKGECGGTSGDFLVYGGRAPYTARSSLPNAIRLSVNGVVGDPVVIQSSGGSFRASTSLAACAGYKGSIVVTDSAGRNFEVTYEEQQGENEVPAPPAPTTLVISPRTVTVTCPGPPSNRAVTFSVVGGTAPYTLRTSRPGDTLVSGNTVTITSALQGPNATSITVEVTDSKSNVATSTINCQ